MSQSGALRFTGGGGGGTILTLTGNSGGPVGPDGFGDINVIGDGTTITVAGNPGTSTLTISVLGSVAIQFTADDTNVATPAGGNLNIFGGPNINTEVPAADTIQVNLNESILLPSTIGPAQGVIALGVDLTTDRFMHAQGTDNTFLGDESGNFTLTGFAAQNVGIGTRALNSIEDGNSNTGVGYQALAAMTEGGGNTALGRDALGNLPGGLRNIGIGRAAGLSYTSDEFSNIVIGNSGIISDDNTIRIGTQGVGLGEQDKAYMAGIYQTTPGATYEVGFVGSDGKLGTLTGNDLQVIKGNTGANPEWATVDSPNGSIIISDAPGFLNLEVLGIPTEFTVTTNNAVPTPIATFPLPDGNAWTIIIDIVAAKDDFTASYWGSGPIGVRKQNGATPSVVVGVQNFNQGSDSGTGVPSLTATATGGPDIDINVTGIAAEIWNWKAIISTVELP